MSWDNTHYKVIANKVQSRFDFEGTTRDTHPRSEALARYFAAWLERLGIDENRYAELASLLG